MDCPTCGGNLIDDPKFIQLFKIEHTEVYAKKSIFCRVVNYRAKIGKNAGMTIRPNDPKTTRRDQTSGVADDAAERSASFSALLRTPQISAALVEEVATVCHEAWKRDHFAMRGAGTPRWKATRDEAFIEAHRARVGDPSVPWLRLEQGKLEVNIAALTYPQLPRDWQGENRATGEVVLQLLQGVTARGGDPFSTEFMHTATNEIHAQWLERNGAYAEPLQKKTLPEMIALARDPSAEERPRAYRNVLMDLNYILTGVQTLLKYEFITNAGLPVGERQE